MYLVYSYNNDPSFEGEIYNQRVSITTRLIDAKTLFEDLVEKFMDNGYLNDTRRETTPKYIKKRADFWKNGVWASVVIIKTDRFEMFNLNRLRFEDLWSEDFRVD